MSIRTISESDRDPHDHEIRRYFALHPDRAFTVRVVSEAEAPDNVPHVVMFIRASGTIRGVSVTFEGDIKAFPDDDAFLRPLWGLMLMGSLAGGTFSLSPTVHRALLDTTGHKDLRAV